MPDRPSFDGLDDELLDRFLAGECSEHEAALVRRHLMVHPGAAHLLQRVLEELEAAEGRPEAPPSEESWKALRQRFRTEAAEPPRPRPVRSDPHAAPVRRQPFTLLPPSPPPRWWRRRPAIVAMYVGAALAGLGLHRLIESREAPASRPELRVYATSPRERAELLLSDGTRVRLAPATRLRVSSDYGTERRDVYLDGQAYFEVVHDERHPFTVFVRNASAHDLGTTFAVRGYPEDRDVQVIVRDGAVAMSGVGRLGAGDIGQLRFDGQASRRHVKDLDAALAWLDGRLVFRDVPLEEVLRELHRWYDARVELSDTTLATLPFTGTITEGRTSDAVELVAATLGLAVRQTGERFVLVPVPGRTPRASARSRAATRATRDATHAAKGGAADVARDTIHHARPQSIQH